MNPTCICEQEITPQMVREGQVVNRGNALVCRGCSDGKKRLAAARSAALRVGRSGRDPSQSGRGPARGASALGGGWSPEADRARPRAASDPRSAAPEAPEYASFFRRFGAHVIDSLILNVAVFLGGLFFAFGAGRLGVVEPTVVTLLGAALGAVVPVGYCVWFWMRTGGTPGKLALGVRVVSADGGPITAGQSLVRYLGYMVSTLVFGLGYLWMLWDDERRCWHDVMAGTRVLHIP